MTAVLLTTLKIIGIVIASAVALVLLVLALVLFVPIRYRIRAKKECEDGLFTAEAVASYLLHIVSFHLKYDKGTDKCLRIFGIRFKRKEKKDKDKTDSENTGAGKEEDGTQYTENLQNETAHDISGTENIPEKEDFSIDWNDDGDESGDDTGKEEPGVFEKIADAVISKYDLVSEKYEKIRREARFWDRMYNDERNRNAVELIRRCVVKLLRKIAPKRVKGFVHFGFEDPATTGKVLMYLAIIYPTLPRKLDIEPGFGDTDIYGNADIKGRLALITVAVILCRLYFNKDCKRMWRIYKRHSGR